MVENARGQIPELEVGDPLPELRAPSSNGQTLERASFVGRVPVVVFFPVPTRDPLDGADLMEWDEHLVDFGHLRVQLLGVVRARPRDLRDAVESGRFSVTLLADEAGEIARRIGGDHEPRPTVIADHDGIVVDIVTRSGELGHAREVLDRVRELQARLGDSMHAGVHGG
jgi:peroxiredoxin Q/BCP